MRQETRPVARTKIRRRVTAYAAEESGGVDSGQIRGLARVSADREVAVFLRGAVELSTSTSA